MGKHNLFNKKRMLWIEDSARFELSEQLAPVYYKGDYSLHLAENVSDGINHLHTAEESNKPYDVIIIDVRLPPGEDKIWQAIYKHTLHSRVESQLGLILLYWLFAEVEYDESGEIIAINNLKVEEMTRTGNPDAGKDIAKRLKALKGIIPPEVDKSKIAVYSVEPRTLICPHLRWLGLKTYAKKSISTPDDILLQLADAIQAGGNSNFECAP